MSARKPGSSWLDWTGGRPRGQAQPAPAAPAEAWPPDDEWTVDAADAEPEVTWAASAEPAAADDDEPVEDVALYDADEEVDDDEGHVSDVPLAAEPLVPVQPAVPMTLPSGPLLPALAGQVAHLEGALAQLSANVADIAATVSAPPPTPPPPPPPPPMPHVPDHSDAIAALADRLEELHESVNRPLVQPDEEGDVVDGEELFLRLDAIQSAMTTLSEEIVELRDEIGVVRRRVGVRAKDGLTQAQLAEIADVVAGRVLDQMMATFDLAIDRAPVEADEPFAPPEPDAPPAKRPRRGREPLIGRKSN